MTVKTRKENRDHEIGALKRDHAVFIKDFRKKLSPVSGLVVISQYISACRYFQIGAGARWHYFWSCTSSAWEHGVTDSSADDKSVMIAL